MLGLTSGWADTSGTFLVSFVSIFTEKEFKAGAMVCVEVTTTPSTCKLEIFLEVLDEGNVLLSAFQNC